jgi:hypothetical protein
VGKRPGPSADADPVNERGGGLSPGPEVGDSEPALQGSWGRWVLMIVTSAPKADGSGPNLFDGRLHEPVGGGPGHVTQGAPPESAQNGPGTIGPARPGGQRSRDCHAPPFPAPGLTLLGLAVVQSSGSYTESERVWPTRAGVRCRGNQGPARDADGTEPALPRRWGARVVRLTHHRSDQG